MDTTTTDIICTQLPSYVNNCFTTCKNTQQYILNFLQNALPPSDVHSISDSLRKNFIFSKLKTKFKLKGTKVVKNRGKFFTNRKRILLGLSKIGYKHGIKYSELLPLNKLWQKYMEQMLGCTNNSYANIPRSPIEPNWESVNQQLSKSDFHGARISVEKSNCASLVGMNGIIIQDTKNAFRVCGKDNIIRLIPKDGVEFNIYLGCIRLRILGKHLIVRPAERTVKKYKATRIYDI